jgi:hypothetical protein
VAEVWTGSEKCTSDLPNGSTGGINFSSMATSEWIAVIALIIASGGFALQASNWLMSKPHLHLSVIADAMSMPDDGRGVRVALTVINRGGSPTLLTHMVVYVFRSRWRRLRNKPDMAALVPTPDIPAKLDINGLWMGMMPYNSETSEARAKGRLYIGVCASHHNGHQLVRVPPPKKQDVPKAQIPSG